MLGKQKMYTNIMDVAERREERPQCLLRDQRRQSAHKNCGIVGIRRRKLLTVGADEVAEDRSRLGLVFPRLFRHIVPGRSVLLLRRTSKGSCDG